MEKFESKLKMKNSIHHPKFPFNNQTYSLDELGSKLPTFWEMMIIWGLTETILNAIHGYHDVNSWSLIISVIIYLIDLLVIYFALKILMWTKEVLLKPFKGPYVCSNSSDAASGLTRPRIAVKPDLNCIR